MLLEAQAAIVTGGGQGIGRGIAAAEGANVAIVDVNAAAVLFFAPPGAAYITGRVLSVNGGIVRAG